MKQMMCLLLTAFFLLGSCEKNNSPVSADENKDILMRLQAIPGVTITEIAASGHFSRVFEASVVQPIDHDNPAGPTFTQKFFVGHVDVQKPVAFETEGYSRDNFRIRELSPLLQCNQITVEHRYNGASKPDPVEWQNLTIRQAANDLHKIVQLLKPIYQEAWVSSGRSKGGMTAVFHRRFYPDDVEATIAFVAPLLFSDDDPRFATYLNTVGDQACRDKIKVFQRNLLLKKDSIAALIPGYVDWVNQNFSTDFMYSISYESVVKHSAIDYPFEFWSSTQHDCASIPDSNASAQVMFDHILETVDILLFYSDYGLDFWEGWYYQAETEIGNYKLATDHIDDLLPPLEVLHGFGNTLQFDPAVMQDVDNWVKSAGERIIFIYGEDDPWSIAQFETGTPSVYKIVNPGTKHETAISDLSADDRNLVTDKLSEWLNIEAID